MRMKISVILSVIALTLVGWFYTSDTPLKYIGVQSPQCVYSGLPYAVRPEVIDYTNRTPYTVCFPFFVTKQGNHTVYLKTLGKRQIERTTVTVRPKTPNVTEKNGTFSWEQVKCDEYEVQCSYNKEFEPQQTVNEILPAITVSFKPADNRPYVRVRAVTRQNGDKIYSDWSGDTATTGFIEEMKNIEGCKAYVTTQGVVSVKDYYTKEIANDQRFPDFTFYYMGNTQFVDEETDSMITDYADSLMSAYRLTGITKSDDDITRYLKISKWIYDNVEYNASDSQDIYATSALDNRRTVCGGAAALVRDLCSIAHIPCKVVATKEHEWNIVFLDGKWYYDEFGLLYIRLKNMKEDESALKHAFFSPYVSDGYVYTQKITPPVNVTTYNGEDTITEKLIERVMNI